MLERELKFTPGPAFRLPDLDDAELGVQVGVAETIRLQAGYYDTADLRLARAGASLRHRNDEGWVVKLPVGSGDVLTRLEQRIDGDPGDPPPAALDLLRALIRTAPVQLVTRLSTLRRRVVLYDPSGKRIGELVDDEVSVLDGARLTARFRELELELTDHAPTAVVDALVARLRSAGAGEPDPVPKIVRALGPRALDPPDVVAHPSLGPAPLPLDVLRAAIATSAARLSSHDPGVRLGTDPEDVHQARVATRRLRSDLRTFRILVDHHWSESLRDELKWLGDLLGAVRDTDVLLERLQGRLEELAPSDHDPGMRILARLVERRDEARRELLDALRSDRYVALLDRLVEAAHHVPPAPPPGVGTGDEPPDIAAIDARVEAELDVASLVRPAWRHLQKAVRALGDDPADAALHEVRIRAKRCRYAAEAVAAAVGERAGTFARAVTRLQDVLGEHQDAVVAERWLRDDTREIAGDPDALFVAGELAALERVAARAARACWPAVWRKARRKRLRRWL